MNMAVTLFGSSTKEKFVMGLALSNFHFKIWCRHYKNCFSLSPALWG
jgi:hypothetical protein